MLGDVPADMVRGGLCMSGMYDMKPARLSKRSSYVKFTDEMEQAMSSQRQIDKLPNAKTAILPRR
jgi:arylformamidase